MLTKERTSKTRKFKYAAVALALLAVLVFCFASCGKATPTGIEYVAGTAAKVDYNQGETFDCTGAQIKVTYDNGAVETKDVTTEMVGNAPLALGVESVNVTYSENGATVVGFIPVSVTDPYSDEKAAAIDAIRAKDDKIDKGIDILIRDYTAKINAATSVDAVNTAKANFETALAEYLADKAEILAGFESDADLKAKLATLEEKYPQFFKDIKTEKANAIANINAASTIDEAKDYFNAFKAAVDNKIAETEDYEKNEEDEKGLIYAKIDLLTLIEKYETRIELLSKIVEEAKADNHFDGFEVDAEGNPTDVPKMNAYYEMVGGNGVEGVYPAALARLAWWNKYVTLAISLAGVEDDINDEMEERLSTGVDAAAELLFKGTTLYPTSYKKDEAGNYIDVTAKFISDVEVELGKAEKKFGAKGLATLKAEYGVIDGVVLIDKVLNDIKTNYAWLNEIRTAALPSIAAIEKAVADVASDTLTTAQKKTAVETAWATLKAWGTTTDKEVFTLKTFAAGEATYLNNILFDTENFDKVVYTADVSDKGIFASANAWAAYATNLSKDYVVEYFVPNFDDLVKATEKYDAIVIDELVDAIPEIDNIIYSYTAADSKATIDAADAAIKKFVKDHTEEVFRTYFPVVEGKDKSQVELDVADAYAQYKKLVDLADEANAAIDAYEKLLDDENRGVVISDYVPADSELPVTLQAAYEAYLAFVNENKIADTANEGEFIYYTDVIESTKGEGVITDTDNETNLVKFMTDYVTLKYKEQEKVQTTLIINGALVEVLSATDENTQTDFRADLTEYANQAIEAVENAHSFDPATEVTDNYSFITVLNKKIDEVKKDADEKASYIRSCGNAGTMITQII